MGARSFVTARLMETWAHGQDVADALGVDRGCRPARLRHVAHIGVRARPFSYAIRDMTLPDVEVRVSSLAPDGTTWTWGDPASADVVSGSALDFCLVVTQRRHAARHRHSSSRGRAPRSGSASPKRSPEHRRPADRRSVASAERPPTSGPERIDALQVRDALEHLRRRLADASRRARRGGRGPADGRRRAGRRRWPSSSTRTGSRALRARQALRVDGGPSTSSAWSGSSASHSSNVPGR